MKNLINFFIQLFKSEWNKPKELCLAKSVFFNRLWMLIPLIYVVFIIATYYMGLDKSKTSVLIADFFGSLFVVFSYLWAMIGSFIINNKQHLKNASLSEEEIENIMKLPILVSKWSLIIIFVSLIFIGPIAIIVALMGY
jgi:hypothetical protein